MPSRGLPEAGPVQRLLRKLPAAPERRGSAHEGCGLGPCAVPGCERPWANSPSKLCHTHLARQKRLHLPMDQFLADPKLVAFGGYGVCQVAACPRDRDCGENPYCTAHRRRWNRALRANPGLDETLWRKMITPISENNEVSLRGLPEPLRVEILYGPQERVRAGIRTRATVLRSVVNLAREQRDVTLERVVAPPTVKQVGCLRTSILQFVQRSGLHVESEITKDVWNWSVFGTGHGHLRFDRITQPWLREAAKRLAMRDRRAARPCLDGRHVLLSHTHIVSALPTVAVGASDHDAIAMVWVTEVWRRWRAGLVHLGARTLAEDIRIPGTLVADLDPQGLVRLAAVTRLRSPGIRRLLDRLTTAGLLASVESHAARGWGSYCLRLPADAVATHRSPCEGSGAPTGEAPGVALSLADLYR